MESQSQNGLDKHRISHLGLIPLIQPLFYLPVFDVPQKKKILDCQKWQLPSVTHL